MILDIEHKDVTYFLSPCYSDAPSLNLCWPDMGPMVCWLSQAKDERSSARKPLFTGPSQSKCVPGMKVSLERQVCPRYECKFGETIMGTRQRHCMPGEGLPMFLLCRRVRIQDTALLHSRQLSDLSSCQCISTNYTNKLGPLTEN